MNQVTKDFFENENGRYINISVIRFPIVTREQSGLTGVWKEGHMKLDLILLFDLEDKA